MQTTEIPIEQIRPYWNNPRKNDATINRLCKSIEDYGFNVPLVVNKDMVIITGHARLKAAKKLGMATVPCVVVDLTDEQAKKYRVADNKIQELTEWDEDALVKELREIGGEVDILELGFTVKDIEHYLGSITPEEPIEVVESVSIQPSEMDVYVPRQVVQEREEQIAQLQEELKQKEQELVNRFPQESYESTKFDNLVVCPHCGKSFKVRGLKPENGE